MLWIIGIMNAINFIDGLDGLAAGVVIISSLSLLAVSYGHHEFVTILVTIILLGATIGFLKYNLPPAKTFLGDTGSMFLGLIMASVSLLENRKGTVTITLLLPIVIMGVPIIDTFVAIIRRIINKKSPFERDKEHIHHRLLKLGLSPKQVLLLIYSIGIYLGFTAYILSVTPRQYHLVTIIVLGTGLFIGVETLKFIERRSKRDI
jgi:UDP-GlcNAc:undecaprenyl-phosphate GlcNAc-1-phosphate transferase